MSLLRPEICFVIRGGASITSKTGVQSKTGGVSMNIDEIVKQVVQKQLAPAKIVDLTVEKDEDADGDPILRIEVVFEAEGDRLDPEKVLGLGRHLHERLHQPSRTTQALHSSADRFPIFSFMTSEEAADAAA